MNMNGPLLQENYAWVDECLREKYYNNFVEKELLYNYELVVENSISLLKPTPITWANYKSNAILKCIEEKDDEDEENNEICITYKNRKRAESDISNYELNVGKVILNAYSNSLLEDNFNLNFDYFEDVSTTNSSYSEESYYSYDSY
jgi:tRNA-binding EMAP/Myf-like protein